jgi:polysaccharide deacetylase family protein (PEP-CTERM system associated)
MSVDVEDYFQVEAFADRVSRESWDCWPSRVVDNTRRSMEIFARHQVQATFFIVGWVARKFPHLVREVVAAGHEAACHSYWHRTVFSLTPEEFRQDLREARDAIEQAGGQRVIGYRAPSWSITGSCMWALNILAEEEFVYDSSIYPIMHDIYGVPDAQRTPYLHRLADGRTLQEFPPATVRCFSTNIPAAGGGYLRIFPFRFTEWVFRHLEREHGQPVVVYFHPWEIDPGQPRIPGRLRSRLRHYTNLGRMESRIEGLLERHRFQSFRQMIDASAAGGGA